ncbi:MAG TPA: class I SAM-dependent methyltransferase [Candidatus Sulfomarinibacteraceae bacterium]|nr:class I SAM-dependent methyltransferase [Candidatus Sulfomarinibacteraceae bacterium]
MTRSDTMGWREGGATGTSDRRRVLARRILEGARAALPADSPLELVLADDVTADRSTAVRVVVRGPDAAGRLIWPPSADTLGEAYLRGDIEIEGDIWTAIDAGRSFDPRRLGRDLPLLARLGIELRRGATPAPILRRRARLSGRRHSRARDLAAIRFHYDVGNEFFSLWLDRRLVYSCAYFETPDTSLDDAQEAKLDLICRKLRLEPGMRLLDIGCGWGSLVMHAVERYGVEATGITLSSAQASWAAEEIGRRGLNGRALVTIRDYRDLQGLGAFDAVASVGMFEHVGRERLGEYFGAAFDALKPHGLFLNHGIATTATGGGLRPRWLRFGDGGFVGRYVFPDGELVTVEDAAGVARRAGFELIDVQRLRPHYALTLKAWVERLEAAAGRARELAGDEVYRTWRIYMAASRRGFEDGSLDVAQLLLARPNVDGPAALPLRPWWHG